MASNAFNGKYMTKLQNASAIKSIYCKEAMRLFILAAAFTDRALHVSEIMGVNACLWNLNKLKTDFLLA
jgi:hypothetical protein